MGGRESANNKYRITTGEREKTAFYNGDRKDNSLKREYNEREKEQTPSSPLTQTPMTRFPLFQTQQLRPVTSPSPFARY